MDEKAKITVEIPGYLKAWIKNHDVGQNAIVTMALRLLYMQEKQADESIVLNKLIAYFENKKLPF